MFACLFGSMLFAKVIAMQCLQTVTIPVHTSIYKANPGRVFNILFMGPKNE